MIKNNSSLIEMVLNKFNKLNIDIDVKNVKVLDIPLENLKKNSNKVRMSGESEETIQKIIEIINDNQYDPYKYIPPVVEKSGNKYIIISGHHRFYAHLGLARETMMCVVVKFKNEYDRSRWRVAENQSYFDGHFKEISTDSNTINTVAKLVRDNVVDADADSIKNFLLSTQCVKKNSGSKLDVMVSSILKKSGNEKCPDFVKMWTDTERVNIISNLKKKLPNRNYHHHVFKAKKDVDYDKRVINSVLKDFFKDPAVPVTILYSVNKGNKNQIEKIRKYKPEHLINDFFNMCQMVIDLYNKGYDLRKKVTLEHLPQFGEEIKSKNDGLNKFYSYMNKKYSKNTRKAKNMMVCSI